MVNNFCPWVYIRIVFTNFLHLYVFMNQSALRTIVVLYCYPEHSREGSGVEVSKTILHLGWKFHSIGFLISKFEFSRQKTAPKFKFTNKKSNGMEFPSQMENCFWNFYSWPFSNCRGKNLKITLQLLQVCTLSSRTQKLRENVFSKTFSFWSRSQPILKVENWYSYLKNYLKLTIKSHLVHWNLCSHSLSNVIWILG